MSKQLILDLAIAAVVLAFVVGMVFWRKRRPRLNVGHYTRRWRALQKHCATRKTWPLAVIAADDLLDEALKKRRYKGKTPGERMVSAQHTLTSNDTVWFGHKLRNSIIHEDVRKLKKADVLQALNGFRQALSDLGAFKND